MDTIRELLNNSAFWIFLGTAVTAYFSYKGLVLPYQKKKQKVDVSKVSTFEELKAAMEILSTALERQDQLHSKQMAAAYQRIADLEANESKLYDKIANLQSRLRDALNGNGH